MLPEFAPHAVEISKVNLWNRRFTQVFARLLGTSVQKITATEDGILVLGVYKPGDDRSSVLFSVAKQGAGLTTSQTRPPSHSAPNSLVQQMRKHMSGRRIKGVYASLEPTAVVVEFWPSQLAHAAKDSSGSEEVEEPDTLILDLGSRPPRICLCKRYNEVPKRYLKALEQPFEPGQVFFESFCEWSLAQTRTKRRATYLVPFVTYSCVTSVSFEAAGEGVPDSGSSLNKGTGAVAPEAHGPTPDPVLAHPSKPAPPTPSTTSVEPVTSVSHLPVHVRRAVKTKLQFLERRIMRQKQDLPKAPEMELLDKRAKGLQTHLYMWPVGSAVWFVPRELIEEFSLPAMVQLKTGEKPGELLNRYFSETEKLKRRTLELKIRIAESEKALADFNAALLQVLAEVGEWRKNLKEESLETGSHQDRLTALFSRPPKPPSAESLLRWLDVEWSTSAQKSKENDDEKTRRLPYRSFLASTGEFIRVAKSAADGDAMIKKMPTHHTWIHIMTGEGSHVWLEHPKKRLPTPQAVREAAILAIHHSKVSRSLEGEVYVAKKADIEKKKDLPPGKVIVRRAQSLYVRYENSELRQVLESGSP